MLRLKAPQRCLSLRSSISLISRTFKGCTVYRWHHFMAFHVMLSKMKMEHHRIWLYVTFRIMIVKVPCPQTTSIGRDVIPLAVDGTASRFQRCGHRLAHIYDLGGDEAAPDAKCQHLMILLLFFLGGLYIHHHMRWNERDALNDHTIERCSERERERENESDSISARPMRIWLVAPFQAQPLAIWCWPSRFLVSYHSLFDFFSSLSFFLSLFFFPSLLWLVGLVGAEVFSLWFRLLVWGTRVFRGLDRGIMLSFMRRVTQESCPHCVSYIYIFTYTYQTILIST